MPEKPTLKSLSGHLDAHHAEISGHLDAHHAEISDLRDRVADLETKPNTQTFSSGATWPPADPGVTKWTWKQGDPTPEAKALSAQKNAVQSALLTTRSVILAEIRAELADKPSRTLRIRNLAQTYYLLGGKE